MRVGNSKSFQFSHNDVFNIIGMVLTSIGAFYMANTELINSILESKLSQSEFALATAFLYFIIERFVKDNTN